MRYAKLNQEGNWNVMEINDGDEASLFEHGWYRLVEHEEPHESWNPERWRPIEHLQPQHSLHLLHRFHRIVPIDAYEPERATLVFSE
jgi:hypothetical protein